jgi:probable phosphoglycerate mutase
MSETLPTIYVARHGETAWSLSGQHTGLTDLPLTDRGERNASRLGERLKGLTFSKVFTSPLQRAMRTCELAGFGSLAEIDRDLLEWNYGEYETAVQRRFLQIAPAGNFSVTAVPGANPPVRLARVPIAW